MISYDAAPMSRTTRIVAWVWFLALVVLHLDFWRPQRPDLWFGWLPEDMAYRLAWMVGAFFFLLFFTYRVWNEEGES